MKSIKITKKWIIWENPDQRLIRAKKSWGCGNYILEIKKPFKSLICGLTVEDVLNKFKVANSNYWNLVAHELANQAPKVRKKKKK